MNDKNVYMPPAPTGAESEASKELRARIEELTKESGRVTSLEPLNVTHDLQTFDSPEALKDALEKDVAQNRAQRRKKR